MAHHEMKCKFSFYLSVTAILFLLTPSTALDPSAYSVPLRGTPVNIAAEKTSSYIISSSDGEFTLPDTAFQQTKTISVRGGRKYISLSAGELNGPVSPPSASDRQNTRFLELDNPKIRSTAARFAGSRNITGDVERFVYARISRKATGIPLLPASSILENRTGDCTEHSILSIAILRANGIPARAMVGMIFCEEYEGLSNIFVFHMWVEAYTAGRWVLVDATRPGAIQSNRYIAFTTHSLRTEAPLAYLKAISAIRDLTVEPGRR